MTNELAVPSPTSFLLPSVQVFPLLCTPSVHHSHPSGYLPGTTSNLGGGGGGGGGGNGGGGLHWQTSWQLSVTLSATGLGHDFWGSPWVICEETSHCMSSRKSENLFSMNVLLGLKLPSGTSSPGENWVPAAACFSLRPLQGLFPMWSQFYFIFYLT